MPIQVEIAKIDINQTEIVQHLRSLGAIVTITSGIGSGFPDLVVGNPDTMIVYLMEVKSEKGKLTKSQKKFHAQWGDLVHIVRNKEMAEDIYYGRYVSK